MRALADGSSRRALAFAVSALGGGAVLWHATPLSPAVAFASAKEDKEARKLQRKATLQHATGENPTLKRVSTRAELRKLRENEDEMNARWEKDEDGWRKLPARAWPAFQPDPYMISSILNAAANIPGCEPLPSAKKAGELAASMEIPPSANVVPPPATHCSQLLFDLASGLVFSNIDPAAGLSQYQNLAAGAEDPETKLDAIVAVGVILNEGLGVAADETEGLNFLREAAKSGSAQACYELGSALYCSSDGAADEKEAFQLFKKSAAADHTAGLFMMADCLIHGVGTTKNVARAVPLLYKAAERGHRFARQCIRELLASDHYK